MDRRQFLGATTAGWVSALTGVACVSRPDESELGPVRDIARAFVETLSAETKAQVMVDYDHPLRQYHNRGVRLEGARVNRSDFDGAQRKLLSRLVYSGLSDVGRGVVPRQQFLRWMGFRSLHVLIAGDPSASEYQVIFSGPHLNLRLGGKNREGVAFGGPLVYGDQRGNGREGLPGNMYRYQFLEGVELFEKLTAAEQRQSVLDTAPIQTQIELKGDGHDFAGVPVHGLAPKNKQRVTRLIEGILRNYHPEDVAYAQRCIESNGGVDALHLSYYKEGDPGGKGRYQIFRLEGPAAVFYFRGAPHVHAFINIGMDGNRPLSVGEQVCENKNVIEGPQLKALFEAVMKDAGNAEFAFYDRESAVGRLRRGTIRTGDIYNLESWRASLYAVTIKGSELTGYASEDLTRQGVDPKSDRSYRIVTTSYLVEEELRRAFGNARTQSLNLLLRDEAIRYLRKHGTSTSA